MKKTRRSRSRTDSVIKNGIWSTISYIFTILIGMYCQRVFVLEMGYSLYGLNAMFTTIVSTLAVTELGFGTAIIFSLYKPLAEGDEKKVGALVSLYRRIYIFVGLSIMVGSCILIPFLPALTGFAVRDFLLPYLIFVANTVLTYFFTFNQTILNADQKNYVVSMVFCMTRVSYNVLQIAVIYLTHSFILYTVANMICTLTGNVVLSRIVRKNYPYIYENGNEKLDKGEVNTIKTKVLALIFHKIGGYLVNGGDNFILSGFLGVATVGYYSNYTYITNMLKSLITSIFTGFMAGFGNLNATEKTERALQVFKRARFIYFVLYTVTSVGLYCCAEPFLCLLYTEQTILPHTVLFIIVLNYFIYGYSACYGDYRLAAGVFEPDKYLSLAVPVLNVFISIALVKPLGVLGVLIGTFICYFVKECTAVPIICCKYVFKCRAAGHLVKFWADTALAMAICFTADYICRLKAFNSLFISFMARGIFSVFFACLVIFLVFGRSDEFKYAFTIILRKVNRGGQKK